MFTKSRNYKLETWHVCVLESVYILEMSFGTNTRTETFAPLVHCVIDHA